ncbi:hypothetical protein BH10PSE6_BH10PSE6_19580 [soil metagenome]
MRWAASRRRTLAAHKDAVSLFERTGKRGDNDALKALANKYPPHLQEPLKMAQDMTKEQRLK